MISLPSRLKIKSFDPVYDVVGTPFVRIGECRSCTMLLEFRIVPCNLRSKNTYADSINMIQDENKWHSKLFALCVYINNMEHIKSYGQGNSLHDHLKQWHYIYIIDYVQQNWQPLHCIVCLWYLNMEFYNVTFYSIQRPCLNFAVNIFHRIWCAPYTDYHYKLI